MKKRTDRRFRKPSGLRILITGGAGFIGSRIARLLCRKNEVIIYDNFRRNALPNLQFPELRRGTRVKVVEGDILDADRLEEAMKGVHIVFHLAAVAGVDTVIKNPVDTLKINAIGTYHVMEAVRNNRQTVGLVVNFSTSEVFGIHSYKAEESEPTHMQPVGEARWVYATSKLVGEFFVHSYFKQYGIPACTIRPFNIYGPGQVGEGAVHIFIKRALKGLPLYINGDGDQIRSWCYIDDLIYGVELVLGAGQKVDGEVFNIGNPKGTVTINELAERIIRLTKSGSTIVYLPKRYADVELRVPSIDKARTILGFEPKISLSEGLLKTIAWYRRYAS